MPGRSRHFAQRADADRELFDAELNLTQTKRNEVVSLVQLYKALGGGWQQ
jgi:outer membrane protein, multidrug efflux system